MSRQTFPPFVDQPGYCIRNFRITGASVGASAGSAGLDGRGEGQIRNDGIASPSSI